MSGASQISASTPQIDRIEDSRDAINWAMKAKKGQVSPIFGDETEGRFLAVALNDVYEDYIPATDPQVKKMLTAKIRNDKKADALIAQYNGKAKDINGYAAAMGVKADTATVNFAEYTLVYPDFAPYNPCYNLKGHSQQNSCLYLIMEGVRSHSQLLLTTIRQSYAHAAIGIRAHGHPVHGNLFFVQLFNSITGLYTGRKTILFSNA